MSYEKAAAFRYLCDPRQRRSSTQQIWEEILDAVAERADIDFVYPTQRFYNNMLEGKEEARVFNVNRYQRSYRRTTRLSVY